MLHPTEQDERQYLKEVLQKLKNAIVGMEQKIEGYSEKILETKRYIWENMAQLDSAEKAANRVSANEDIFFGEKAVAERNRMQKLFLSPYFGRIDFVAKGESSQKAFYIGIFSFFDPAGSQDVIYDWRAPVSSMFYDFEIGPALYTAPGGRMQGDMLLKRQYRIKNSRMEYMIESALNIGDEILQQELSRTSDEKMKNIVATIQREQNSIIRNESAKVFIIQGVAGSGKTSIALHRVAFLLYRYKDTLTSKNILIVSPNKVFGNFISNVLPELGEENIEEIGFETIGAQVLGKKFKFQTFSEQVAELLESHDPSAVERIRFKATNEFVSALQAYLVKADEQFFTPVDLELETMHISQKSLLDRYQASKRMPIKKRLQKMAADYISQFQREKDRMPDGKAVSLIKSSIQKMYRFQDAFSLYKHFYLAIGKPEFFLMKEKNTFEFCDVFPFAYMKLYFDGSDQDYSNIKHLLVDEMQDYTPIQYAVLARLFRCKMTILGDSHQSVNPYSSSSVEKIRPYFDGCDCVELCKSYRSTFEITRFAQGIRENKKLIPIERHGEAPVVTRCKDESGELYAIEELIRGFSASGYSSLGIICKSQKQANMLFDKLKPQFHTISLLNEHSSEFQEGVVVASVHMTKGLEFDQVIVPDLSSEIYATDLDKSLLYIACTRAMHRLSLLYFGEKSRFLKEE